MCVCVSKKERERERESEINTKKDRKKESEKERVYKPPLLTQLLPPWFRLLGPPCYRCTLIRIGLRKAVNNHDLI